MTSFVFPVLLVVWLVVIVGFWTGAMHRWLRARDVGRQFAVVIQAVVLAFLFTGLWVASDPARTAPEQLGLLLLWQFLVAYGAVLLRLRWMRQS